ncbi:protein kinase domain-containing protein [Streptomyces albiaxialis]|uniref:protein kinase domain-containing protein n=1 Tax=Streptomyces albiaxialis TaxID=329523 RepID=UPI0031D82C65
MTDGIASLDGSGSVRLGPFRLYGTLGSGAAGTVHLGRGAARRGARKRLAAVRALRPELIRDRQLRAEVRRETLLAAEAVDSPYVAAALGCELDSERPWLAAEFVPGVALATLVEQYGPLPEPSLRALGGAVARALAALHAAGTAHRDLRPENVLLTGGAPRVVDHGAALGRTAWHGTSGASGDEEEAPGAPTGARADVFELGALLVFAATARHPFPGQLLPTAREGADMTGVPEALRPALLACLHKTPESRPRAETLVRALDLGNGAARPGSEWLPEPYLHEIGTLAEEARRLAGRRRFGRD